MRKPNFAFRISFKGGLNSIFFSDSLSILAHISAKLRSIFIGRIPLRGLIKIKIICLKSKMRLALPVTLFVGTFAAAAPSFQYTQISVDVAHPHVQNQADALHSSGKPVMNKDEPYHSSLPYNFTLIARNVHGRRLPFGFADLTLADGFARAELGYDTEFALRDEKLINGNRALEYHVAKVFPPWLSLWSLDLPHKYLDFAAFPNPLEGGGKYVLKLPAGRKLTLVVSTQIFLLHLIFDNANCWFLFESYNFWRQTVRSRGSGFHRSSRQ